MKNGVKISKNDDNSMCAFHGVDIFWIVYIENTLRTKKTAICFILYKKAVVLLSMLIMYRLWEPKTYKVAPYDQNPCPEELS